MKILLLAAHRVHFRAEGEQNVTVTKDDDSPPLLLRSTRGSLPKRLRTAYPKAPATEAYRRWGFLIVDVPREELAVLLNDQCLFGWEECRKA